MSDDQTSDQNRDSCGCYLIEKLFLITRNDLWVKAEQISGPGAGASGGSGAASFDG